MDMKAEQVQIMKELKGMAAKIGRLEAEVKVLRKVVSQKRNLGLERGLMELSKGKYHTYRSVSELDRAIKRRNLA